LRGGGHELWPDEVFYASAKSAIKFKLLSKVRLGKKGKKTQMAPQVVFRRLLCGDESAAVTRVEIGIRDSRFPEVGSHFHSVSGKEIQDIALAYLDIPVQIRRMPTASDIAEVPLREAGPYLADLYCRVTSQAAVIPARAVADARLTRAGEPLLLLEYDVTELESPPRLAKKVTDPAGVQLWFYRKEHHGTSTGIWFLCRDRTNLAAVRRMRIGLLRLHAEYQTLKQVYFLIAREVLPYIPRTPAADVLEAYLGRAIRTLTKEKHSTLFPNQLRELFAAYDSIDQEERGLLLSKLEGMRRQIKGKVVAYPPPSSLTDDPPRAMVTISNNDKSDLASMLSKQATAAPPKVGIEGYFRDLVERANLPDMWKRERAGGWYGDANRDARALINWAISKETTPTAQNWSALGMVLLPLFDEVGLESAKWLATFISSNKLCFDVAELSRLEARYGVPRPAREAERADQTAPDFRAWSGPDEDSLDLNSWLPTQPDYFDRSFLASAIEAGASVCRIENDNSRIGTGFLIAPDLVLTNRHVWDLARGDTKPEALLFRFGCYSQVVDGDTHGQAFRLAGGGLIASSSVDKLDYAVLRLENLVRAARGLRVATTGDLPTVKQELHIWQHPAGDTLKLAVSLNSVTDVLPNGRVQYLTRAQGGSSGAPCFNSQWRVVAIHHGERARIFGSIREGILLDRIMTEIAQYLH
jgi:hypothetical protein